MCIADIFGSFCSGGNIIRMKMKKLKMLVPIVLILVLFMPVTAFSIEENIDSYSDEINLEEMLSAVDSKTAELLSELGIDDISFESVFSVTPKKVLTVLFGVFTGSLKEPFAVMLTVIGIIIISSLISGASRFSETVSLIASSSAALALFLPLSSLISDAFSVLMSLNAFTVAFSGVLCALLSASGNVTLGFSYGTFTAFLCPLITTLTESISAPVVSGVSALAFLSCFNMFTLTERCAAIIKKSYIFILGLLSTVFTGMLSVKSVLSASADSVAQKSVKFIVGRSIPIVGGAVSESYSSVMASLVLIKNTAGVFGIITAAIIVLPVTGEIISWLLSVSLALIASEAFGAEKISSLLTMVKDVLVLMLATVLFSAVVFIVGAGVVIMQKGGAS